MTPGEAEAASQKFNQWYGTQRSTTGVVDVPEEFVSSGGVAPNHVVYNGTLMNRESLASMQQNQADFAAGKTTNIGTASAPLYVPKGSAGEANFNQNIAPNIASGALNATGTAPGPNAAAVNPMGSPQVAENLKKAFDATNTSGQAAPQESGAAATAVSQAVQSATPAPQPQTPPEVENFFQTDKIVQPSMQELADFLSPPETRKALEESLKGITDAMGQKAELNLELANMENIMDGTEQDLRDEIEKAGGFATDSQVLNLTISRNKNLLKRATQIQDKLNYIQDVINTNMTMYGFQKDIANQEFQKRSYLMNYKQENDRMVYQATQDAINRNITLFGVDGLYNAAGGDPVKVDRLERAMGLMPGGLQAAVSKQELGKLADYSITTPYVIKPSGAVVDSQTGYTYTDPQDFQKRTGMTLDQAGQKGMIKDLGMTKKDQQQSFENAVSMENLNINKAQLSVSRYNAETSRINATGNDTSIVDTGSGKMLVTYDKQGNIINEQPIGGSGSNVNTPQQAAVAKAGIEQVNSILNSKALANGVVGTNWLARASLFNKLSGATSNTIADIEQLRSQLNLETLSKAKASGATFGALSDQEMKLLASAASKIGTWAIEDSDGNVKGYNANPKDFKAEMDKINNFAKLDYMLKGGSPQDIGVWVNGNGYLETKNSDGSIEVFEELGAMQQGPGF